MTSIHAYQPAAFMKVEGEDAASFLQGQFTNELRHHAPGSAVYGLFLDQKGKVVADAHILKVAERIFHVMSNHSKADIIRQRLEDYIIADEVVLVDATPATQALALWGYGEGEKIKQLLGGPIAAGGMIRESEMLIYPGRRSRGENHEIVGPEKQIARLRTQLLGLGCQEVGAGESEWVRITEGIPAVPYDIGPGDLPNEGNLVETAISYTKGCYLGQEIMARLKNMGQIRRRLHVVRGIGRAPETGAALFQGGKKFGEIRSVAWRSGEFTAMAMLTKLGLNQPAGLSLAPDQAPTLRIMSDG